MTNIRTIAAALLASASTVAAQDAPTCSKLSPGSQLPGRPTIINKGQVVPDSVTFTASTGGAFVNTGGASWGITSYNCAACQMKAEPGRRPEDTFFAEPVVLSATSSTPVKPGDVIEAVNDQPITSSAGAAQFNYPTAGPATLTVRRGRDRLVLKFVLSLTPCSDSAAKNVVPSIRIRGTSNVNGSAGPIYVIDGVRVEPGATPPAIGYGFALVCGTACSRVTETDGTTFYRYAAAPSISAVRDGSPAATVGLKVGDEIVKIDGRSILEDEAAIRLAHAAQRGPLHVTVLRDGKEIDYLLQSPSKP
jgi:membrane-associated protease RseP (regulator of RpoE activity)